MTRRRWLLLRLLVPVLLLGGLAGASPAEAQADDAQCSAAFPKRIAEVGPTRRGPYAGALLLCSNSSRSATLVLNGTRAVWSVQTPPFTTTYRYPMSSLNKSFLDQVDYPVPLLPAGASMVVFASPNEFGVTVEPGATLAQLAHDQLLDSLAGQSDSLLWAALTDGTTARRALGRCVGTILTRADAAPEVLRTGVPAQQLQVAAREVAANSVCAAEWVQAKVDAGIDRGQITSLASDVSRWPDNAIFRLRGSAAADTWRVLHPDLTVPMREARGDAPGATPWG
jgi:hypothetical protein